MSSSVLFNIALNSKIFENFNMNKLQDIMLTKKYKIENEYKYVSTIPQMTSKEDSKENNEKEVSNSIIDINEYIEPKHTDSLFWCIFIIAHGYKEYKQIGHNYGIKELEEKQKILEFIKKNTSAIKSTNYKITNVAIQEMLSEFMTIQKQTSFLCLIAMIVYYDINILIIDEAKKNILEFLANKESVSDKKTYMLYKTNHGKYKLVIENISLSKIYELRDKYITLDSYLKPLKAISNYKVEELEQMLKKIDGFDNNKKYKKQDLYDKLQELL
jgi:hypothetical protein